LLPRLNAGLPLGAPGLRPFIGARANTAGARLQGKRPDQRQSGWDAESGPGAPKGEARA
jgi:hypothetical protein